MTAVKTQPQFFEGLIPNGDARCVNLRVNYPNDDYFIVETPVGNARIIEILFTGELSIKRTYLPMEATEYRNLDTNEIISQVASFPFSMQNNKVSFEMHRIPESGNTHIILRKLGST